MVIIALVLALIVICSMGPIGFIFLFFSIIVVVIISATMPDKSKEIEEKANKIIESRNSIKNGGIYGFLPSKEICRYFSNYIIYIDESNRKILIFNISLDRKQIYLFDELVECSILEDGANIDSVNVSGAIVGGLIGGDAGMILGGKESKRVTLSLSIRIITTNIQNPLQTIPIISQKMERSSKDYSERMAFAQEIYATMTSIIKSSQRQTYSRNRSIRW